MAISIAGITYKDRNTVENQTLLGWELTTSNTGLARLGINGGSLPTYSGSSMPAAGTTISDMLIASPLDLQLGGITIERCLIRPTTVGGGLPVITTCGQEQDKVPPTKNIIRDCDFSGASLANDQTRAFTIGFYGIADLIRNRVTGFGSGLAITQGGTQLDALVEGNYVNGLVAWGDPATTGNHSDAFTIRYFTAASNPSRQCIVRNNRFDCDSGNDSGAFFIQTVAGRIDNVTVEGNYLEGGGYQLVLETHSGNTYSNMSATNNRFSATGYGPGYVSGGPGWLTSPQGWRYAAGSPPDYKGLVVNL